MELDKIECRLPDFIVEQEFCSLDIISKYGWHITDYDLPELWKKSGKGEGVTVCVLDSGIDLTHPNLKDNIVKSKNFVDPDKDVTDTTCCHGVHVAGTISATDKGNGVVGIAPGVKLLVGKVLNGSGSGTMKAVLAGIKWAIEEKADFICLSLGTKYPVKDIEEALQEGLKSGCIAFVAAGNTGDSSQLLYPAASSYTISIGAHDELNQRADFSTTGKGLNFLAPGVRIFSTYCNGGVAFLSGSSQATPIALGIASLILGKMRESNPTAKITLEELQERLKKGCIDAVNLPKDISTEQKSMYQGWGILNPKVIL